MKTALAAAAFIAFVVGIAVVARLSSGGGAAEPVRDLPPLHASSSLPINAMPLAAMPPLPPFVVVKYDAEKPLAGPREKPMLLHLWATWCGPCREELPSILAFGERGIADVVAVTVDDRWPDVERYFGGKIPTEVWWDPKVTLEPGLDVRSLPTTFLVDTQGRVLVRFGGAHDWNSQALMDRVKVALASAR